MENNELNEVSVETSTPTGLYALDADSRSIVVDYPEQKFKLRHTIVRGEDRDYIRFYHKSPSVKRLAKGESTPLGMPTEPSAELHDNVCNGLIRLSMENEIQAEYSNEQIRDMRQAIKADGIGTYLGGYYSVELSSESGNLDDLLFDRATTLRAEVKTYPDGDKPQETFSIFIDRPDDLTLSRFKTLSHSTSQVDEKQDKDLIAFIGEELLESMTDDEDEGKRVAFTKTVQVVRMFIDTLNKSFAGFENATFNGSDKYQPKDRNEILSKMDPVLKIAIAFSLRNFM